MLEGPGIYLLTACLVLVTSFVIGRRSAKIIDGAPRLGIFSAVFLASIFAGFGVPLVVFFAVGLVLGHPFEFGVFFLYYAGSFVLSSVLFTTCLAAAVSFYTYIISYKKALRLYGDGS